MVVVLVAAQKLMMFTLTLAVLLLSMEEVGGIGLRQICKHALAIPNLPVYPGCDCGGRVASLRYGTQFHLACKLNYTICFDDNQTYCGEPEFAGDYYRRGKESTTDVSFNLSAAFNQTGLGMFKLELVHTAPLSVKHPVSFSSCSVSAGIPCTSCDICQDANGTSSGFKFNCSNVVLFSSAVVNITIPEMDACIFIG